MLYRVLLLSLFALSMSASTISLTGSLDPNNANDVFLYQFTITSPSDLLFQSYGYAGGTNAANTVISPGGFDSYLSIFTGIGDSATFLVSCDDGPCPPGNPNPPHPDPILAIMAAPAGTYTLALTAFDNFSFAEMFGSGTLGDGFIGLGEYTDQLGSLRTSNFALDVTSSAGFASTPEPDSLLLVAVGAAIVTAFRRKPKCS